MRDGGRMETEDIILGKAKYEDWRSIYRNVWSRPETAEYMVWKVTADEDEARERIQRTIAWQETHDAWLVYERGSGQEFYYSTRAGNLASRALALSCGLTYQHSERRTDQRSGKTYELEIYKKNLESIGVGYEAG